MSIEIRPATELDHVAKVLGTKRPDANVCWCLSYRIPSKENAALCGPERAGKVTELLKGGPIGGYPVDNQGEKVDLTMAYVGTRGLFEKAGFHKAADTSSVLAGFPRVVMRLDLR